MQDWLTETASNLGRGIAAGTICPVSLAETYLDAIKAHAHYDRIYVLLTEERALIEAVAARRRAEAGTRRGLLDGVPVSWKDLFDTAGVFTEAGSKLLEGRVPDEDAEVVSRAQRAGWVCIGKTHMSELAFSGLGYNPITASPPCVNDVDAISGGSSSGAAASVAFGLAPLAIGSDTGGSVRIPAAWNDLVGLKTTAGRVSLDGVVPLCARFDTVGPLARSVEDAAQALAILDGSKPVDLSRTSVRDLRLGALKTIALDDLRPAPAQAYSDACSRLSAAGAQIVEMDVPDVAEAMTLAGVLYTAEAYGTWRREIEASPGKMFPEILDRFRAGASYSGPDYVAAWQALESHRSTYARATAGFDAVILPTSPTQPPKLERIATDHDHYVEENLLALRNTRIGNLMGLCALTLPTRTPSCGLMVQMGPGEEARLLRVGAAIEQLLS